MDQLAGETTVHRLGGNSVANLKPKGRERRLEPPGFSVLLGGAGGEAVQQMLLAFPNSTAYSRIHQLAKSVASSTVERIRGAGFDVVAAPSETLPNHARLVHPRGLAGFDDESIQNLVHAFDEVKS